MGLTQQKADAAAFDASLRLSEDEAMVDREIAEMARGMGFQLRVPKASIWAGLLSLLGHSAVAIALTAAPAPPPEPVASYHHDTARTLVLDWDEWGMYAGADSSVAPLGDDDAATADDPFEEPAAEPEVREVAIERPTMQRERTPDPVEPPADEELPASAAPVEALVDAGEKTRVAVPTGDAVGPATPGVEGGSNTDAPTQTAHNGGIGRGRSGGSGPNRAAGGIGDGYGVDINGVRRGHISSLNRAIRSRNPCTRELSHLGLSGDVVMGLIQATDGRIEEVRVLRSSGESLIDQAARDFLLAQRNLPQPDDHLVGEVWQVGLRFKCGN